LALLAPALLLDGVCCYAYAVVRCLQVSQPASLIIRDGTKRICILYAYIYTRLDITRIKYTALKTGVSTQYITCIR
jgi:hypothetical protein